MAWKFPLTARELGDLSSKISTDIFGQKGIKDPQTSVISWSESCIRPAAEMNTIVLPNVLEPYGQIYLNEEKRKQLIKRAKDFAVTIVVGSGYNEFIKTRLYNLSLLDSILRVFPENGVSDFTWAHWPNYEDKTTGKKGIEIAVFQEFNKEHTDLMYLEQRRLLDSLKIAA